MAERQDRPYRIGVDLGGTGIKAGIVDQSHHIIHKASCATGTGRPHEAILSDLAALINRLLAQSGISHAQCGFIGVGSPGMIDHTGGVVVFAANMGWQHVPLVDELGTYFPLPIRLANDASCAVLGESLAGAAKGCRDVALLTLGTGIGSGIISGGVLQQGGSAGGMEFGHTLLVMDGEPCTCGRRGCVEAYASASALIRETRQAAGRYPQSLLAQRCQAGPVDGKTVFLAAQDGCAAACEVIDRYIQYLGEALVNVVNIWRPQVILLGGGLSHEGDRFIAPLNSYVQPRCFAGRYGTVPPIQRAALGNDAGIIGAAALPATG